MKKYKVIDLFAGAGGLSAGFEQTGCYEVVAAVEIDKNARETYKKNHTSLKRDYFFKDIKDIKEEQFEELNDIGVNVVIGGPPCQGFSNANRQRNTLVSTNNQLVKEYIKVIEKLKPIAFVMENVNTMGSDKHKFFKTDNDDSELEYLDIELNDETIVIGNRINLTESLVSFLNDDKYNETFLLDEVVYSKLNTILRKKNLKEYLSKESNYNYLKKLLPRWHHLHPSYWCDEYREKWDGLSLQLKSLLGGDQNNDFISNLKQVIEVQRILMKYKEMIDNKISNNLLVKNETIIIEVQTYNVFEYVTKKLKSLNYTINEDNRFILDSVNFGVPQHRKRLFIVGVRETSIYKGQKVTLPESVLSDKNDFFKIDDAIRDLETFETSTNVNTLPIPIKNFVIPSFNNLLKYFKENNDGYLYNHVITDTREVAMERFRKLKPGQNFHDLDDELKSTYTDHSRTQNTVYKRLSYNSVSGTVLNVRKSMWIHPTLDRAVSIREAARLQSFQDNFIFKGTKDAQYQQVGNAVPPLLARFVAESVLKALGKRPKKKALDLITNDYKENVI
ncbi:DNA (cytosine-5)-methyltransferase 1 [Evansella vedderi]|uniref:Cytosine-specific methyltransferase n=1 Tax=Evansella vedderi TaxID=38282 RepID=A0ABT9ZS96_9BACI|nr:DNA cytosine methyltransferase [Evansella vedderi]MDQ0253358.1 DNA (cytosine-5)-methyltransferase 1 [Evansella vedderi]